MSDSRKKWVADVVGRRPNESDPRLLSGGGVLCDTVKEAEEEGSSLVRTKKDEGYVDVSYGVRAVYMSVPIDQIGS